jgi:hypothetical protein
LATDPDHTKPQELGHALAEVSEKASLLVREEIELARAEVSQKVSRLGKGAVVVAAAGVFAFLGVIFALHTLAYVLWVLIGGDVFWGFLIVTAMLFGLAGISAFLGVRWIKKGTPPTPDMAIEEAKAIKETVSR